MITITAIVIIQHSHFHSRAGGVGRDTQMERHDDVYLGCQDFSEEVILDLALIRWQKESDQQT